MDRTAAQGWLDRYVEAWRTYDPAAIEELFAPDAAHRYHPSDEPTVGPRAIAASWRADPDDAGTYDAAYAPVAVDGDTVVATGQTTYRETPAGPVVRTYDNCFVISFDPDGRATAFTEYYTRRPDPPQRTTS